MPYPLDKDACMTPTNFAISALFWIKCAILALFGAIFFVVFWPLGLVFAYYAIMSGAEALDAAADHLPGDETVYTPRENGRSMDFGPAGAPWGDAEPPLVLEGRVVFLPSIRSIDDRGVKGPDLRVRNGIATPIPGTEAPAYVAVTLHSGDTLCADGEAADRLRSWFGRVAAPEPLPLPPTS